MKRILVIRLVTGIALLVVGPIVGRISAQEPPAKNYGQALIERALARHSKWSLWRCMSRRQTARIT